MNGTPFPRRRRNPNIQAIGMSIAKRSNDPAKPVGRTLQTPNTTMQTITASAATIE
jgi:hypothetical protein